MGGRARLSVDDASVELLDALEDVAHKLEGRWSRFRPHSEVSRLNRAGGAPVIVSPDTAKLVERAAVAFRATRGWFDPMMLREIEHAGYHTSFEAVGSFGAEPPGGSLAVVARPTIAQAEAHPHNGLVQLPSDGAFDPGGLGKGSAADHLVESAVHAGADWAIADLGGDIRVDGRELPFGDFTIDVAHPDGGLVCSLSMASGAAATSGVHRRRWRGPDGSSRHHLLDPRTGRPADSDLVTATVLAGEAWWAEAVATAVVVAGHDEGRSLLDELGLPAVLVDADGAVQLCGDVEEYLL